jgi:hypothetical protein
MVFFLIADEDGSRNRGIECGEVQRVRAREHGRPLRTGRCLYRLLWSEKGPRINGKYGQTDGVRQAAALIAAADSPGRILVIHTREELLIARKTQRVVAST